MGMPSRLGHRLRLESKPRQQRLIGRVDRRTGGAVGQRDVGDLLDTDEGEEGECRRPDSDPGHAGDTQQHEHRDGIEGQTDTDPEAGEDPSGEHEDEDDARDVDDRGEHALEAGEVARVGVPRSGTLPHHEVQQLRHRGREDLVAEDQDHEAVAHQGAPVRHRSPGRRGLGRRSELGGIAPPGGDDQAHHHERGEQVHADQPLRPTERLDQESRGDASQREADRESRSDAGEVRLHLAYVEQAARLAAYQREADRDRQREQHEQGERDPHAVPRGEHQPARRDHHQVDPEHACRHGREGDPALCPGERRGDGDPDGRDREVDVRKGAGAVLVEEERAHRYDEEGHQQAQPHRLPPEQEESRPHRAGGCSCDSRSRRTSSVMTPAAISGRMRSA